ncbi:adaptin ear-binding coat-associated protein 2 isoform X3 [Leopardus geoffroyi]|uniref:adaptin ear-binding coat-associated protein 2 isoform X3 n=1 Tax=Leopardus geoffroyi TaxID=46844 RepID=UPI001E26312F|nr:adaptin ear-binding coat-associated protein 2 isoform X3 [Leopardus geoffroyi]
MEEGEYESVLCVKPEVHVYRIPPRATNRGYRGALCSGPGGSVSWHGRGERDGFQQVLRYPHRRWKRCVRDLVLPPTEKGFLCLWQVGLILRCPSGRRAFIGIGFGDRGDAFDFNVALQDHFKWVKQQCEFAKQAQNPDLGPKLDLGFKEGQTIKLNIANMKKKEGAAGTPRARPASTGGLSLLPPPPGGKTSTLIPPPGEQLSAGGSLGQTAVAPSSVGGATMAWPQPKPATAATADIWGDFTKSTGSTSSQTQPGTGWVQF